MESELLGFTLNDFQSLVFQLTQFNELVSRTLDFEPALVTRAMDRSTVREHFSLFSEVFENNKVPPEHTMLTRQI